MGVGVSTSLSAIRDIARMHAGTQPLHSDIVVVSSYSGVPHFRFDVPFGSPVSSYLSDILETQTCETVSRDSFTRGLALSLQALDLLVSSSVP
jgi:hypothetical protein